MMVQKLEKSVDKDLNKSYQMGVKAQIGSQDTTSKTVDVDSDNVMDRKDSSLTYSSTCNRVTFRMDKISSIDIFYKC